MAARLSFKDTALRHMILDRTVAATHRVEAICKVQQVSTKLLTRLSRSPREPIAVREAALARLAAELAKLQTAPAITDAPAQRQADDLHRLLAEVEEAEKAPPAPPTESFHDMAEKNRPPGDWTKVDLPAVRPANAPLPVGKQGLFGEDNPSPASVIANLAMQEQQRPNYEPPSEAEQAELDRKRRSYLSASFSRDREVTPVAQTRTDTETERRKAWARLEMSGRLNYMTTAEQMRLLGWKDEDED